MLCVFGFQCFFNVFSVVLFFFEAEIPKLHAFDEIRGKVFPAGVYVHLPHSRLAAFVDSDDSSFDN